MTREIILRPSAAWRWENCPASVRLSEGLDSEPGAAAIEGTQCHQLAEEIMRADPHAGTADDWLGQQLTDNRGDGWIVTASHVELVNKAVSTVRPLLAGDPLLFFEREVRAFAVTTPHGTGVARGTADLIATWPAEKRALVVDYKFGRTPVPSDGNPQPALYALGVVAATEGVRLRRLDIAIIQPRVYDEPQIVSLDAADLLEWRLRLTAGGRACVDPAAPAIPGKWCRWCPAAVSKCPATREAVEAPIPAPKAGPDLGALLRRADTLEIWCARVRELAEQEAREGRMPAGYKWVQGRGVRKWGVDDADVIAAAKSAGYDFTSTELLSVPQAEKVTGKKEFAMLFSDLIRIEHNRPSLVPLEDKRPAFDPDTPRMPDVPEFV